MTPPLRPLTIRSVDLRRLLRGDGNMEHRDVPLIFGGEAFHPMRPIYLVAFQPNREFGPPRGLARSLWNTVTKSRRGARVVVTINGRDKSGQPFSQDAVASSLSDSGALLSGI